MNIPQYTQIIAIVIVFALYIYGLVRVIKSTRRISPNKWNIVIGFTFATLFFIYLILNSYRIEPTGFAQIILAIGLVLATALYAISATKQADASMKMAEEMREQRITASRPFIIQRAEQKKAAERTITTDYFSHFEVYNAGNGPAIEVEISLINEEKSLIYSERQSYLRAGESVKLLPVEFEKEQSLPDIEPPVIPVPVNVIIRKKRTYLVSEYQNIFSGRQSPTWYQTWLPFDASKASKEGEIYVKPGELEFKEVAIKDRIDAFGSSKPK
jgi:hypothetical protein